MAFKCCVRKSIPLRVLYQWVLYNQYAVCNMTEPTFNITLSAEHMLKYAFGALVLIPSTVKWLFCFYQSVTASSATILKQCHRQINVQNFLPHAWCPNSCDTIKAIIAFLVVNSSLGRFINDASWKIISPQFSIPPAPKSGSATRSKLIQTDKNFKKGILNIFVNKMLTWF